MTASKLTEELITWVFEAYLPAWAAIGRSERPADDILDYWSIPFFAASMHGTGWLTTRAEVLGLLETTHAPLKTGGYDHTKPLDRAITVFNENAACADAIWSRRNAQGQEIERVATHFDLRRLDQGWRMIALSNQFTDQKQLSDVWANVRLDAN